MPVEIKIFGETAQQAVQELNDFAIGRGGVRFREPEETAADRAPASPAPAPAETAAAPKRRGRPPKGEQAPEPAPILEAIAAGEAASPQVSPETAGATAAPAPAISTTPEDRVNPDDAPEAEEDDGIEEMQEPGAPLTVDDLRNAAGRVVRACGNNTATAMALCNPIFAQNGVESISKCPEEKLVLMVKLINELADAQEKK